MTLLMTILAAALILGGCYVSFIALRAIERIYRALRYGYGPNDDAVAAAAALILLNCAVVVGAVMCWGGVVLAQGAGW